MRKKTLKYLNKQTKKQHLAEVRCIKLINLQVLDITIIIVKQKNHL